MPEYATKQFVLYSVSQAGLRDERGPQGPPGPRGPSGGGPFMFEVDDNGHLLMHYADSPPDIVINDEGHLILTF